jgi:hypothetical protein
VRVGGAVRANWVGSERMKCCGEKVLSCCVGSNVSGSFGCAALCSG